MKRALFISNRFPRPLDTSVTGTFMRMRMILQALSAETDELDLLFFPWCPRWLQGEALLLFQSDVNERWGIRANLTLCNYSKTHSTSARRLGSVIDARNDKKYARTCGDRFVAAIEHCLKRKPELIFVHRLEAMCPLLSVRGSLPPVV